jgi:hypothetical protein
MLERRVVLGLEEWRPDVCKCVLIIDPTNKIQDVTYACARHAGLTPETLVQQIQTEVKVRDLVWNTITRFTFSGNRPVSYRFTPAGELEVYTLKVDEADRIKLKKQIDEKLSVLLFPRPVQVIFI